MTKIFQFVFDNPLGRACVAAAGVFALVAGFAAQQRHKGAVAAVAQIEKANTHVAKIGTSAAAGSTDKRVRGQRDPSTRND